MTARNAQLDTLLTWLEGYAGSASVQKFKGSKIDVPGQFAGLYVSALLHVPQGQALLIGLLEDLKSGRIIHLIDVNTYYASGKRWPDGMCLHGRLLLDTWHTPQSES